MSSVRVAKMLLQIVVLLLIPLVVTAAERLEPTTSGGEVSTADPYVTRFLEPGSRVRGEVSQAQNVPRADVCFGPCYTLTWLPLADVISVMGLGEGVEGAAAGIVGNEIFVSHGYSLGDNAELRIYDMTTDSWSLGNPGSVLRSEGGGVTVGDRLYSISGRTNVPDLEIYDTTTSTWSSGAPVPVPRNGFGLAVVGGLIHMIGGADGGSGPNNGTPLSNHDVYDPATDSWSTRAPLPNNLGDLNAVVAVSDRYIFTFGGFGLGGAVADSYRYDAMFDTWMTIAPMPTPRSNAAAGVLGDRPIVIGGLVGGANVDTVEIYDPATDTWCAGPAKPRPASEIANSAPNSADTIYLIGSGAMGISLNMHEALQLTVAAPVAIPPADATVCAGTTLTLTGQSGPGCQIQYRWLDGVTEICPWSTTPTCDVMPSSTTTYTLETSCVGAGSCVGTGTTTVTVVPNPVADLDPIAAICEGDVVNLGAGNSDPMACPVPLEYRFLDGAVEIQPWGTNSTVGPLMPSGPTTYAVEVRCTVTPGCMTVDTETVDVIALPLANAGADVSICEAEPATVDASGSTNNGCPNGIEYEFRDGAMVVRPFGPSPTWVPPTISAGTTTYTVVVRCIGAPGCEATDGVIVEVRSCPLAVEFDWYRARPVARGIAREVEVTWQTVDESGTLGFWVERSDSFAGPFVTIGEVEEHGAYLPYSFIDRTAPAGITQWYRIHEMSWDGKGDSTPRFTLPTDPR